MADRMVKVMTPAGLVDGIDVPVEEASEKWSELTLKDGTILRTKVNTASVARVPGQYDQQGNPAYFLNAAITVAVVHSPEELRKKVN